MSVFLFFFFFYEPFPNRETDEACVIMCTLCTQKHLSDFTLSLTCLVKFNHCKALIVKANVYLRGWIQVLTQICKWLNHSTWMDRPKSSLYYDRTDQWRLLLVFLQVWMMIKWRKNSFRIPRLLCRKSFWIPVCKTFVPHSRQDFFLEQERKIYISAFQELTKQRKL